jgi:hypothetical protein
MKSKTKTVKHKFTHEEREQLVSDLARAFRDLPKTEGDDSTVTLTVGRKSTRPVPLGAFTKALEQVRKEGAQ